MTGASTKTIANQLLSTGNGRFAYRGVFHPKNRENFVQRAKTCGINRFKPARDVFQVCRLCFSRKTVVLCVLWRKEATPLTQTCWNKRRWRWRYQGLIKGRFVENVLFLRNRCDVWPRRQAVPLRWRHQYMRAEATHVLVSVFVCARAVCVAGR